MDAAQHEIKKSMDIPLIHLPTGKNPYRWEFLYAILHRLSLHKSESARWIGCRDKSRFRSRAWVKPVAVVQAVRIVPSLSWLGCVIEVSLSGIFMTAHLYFLAQHWVSFKKNDKRVGRKSLAVKSSDFIITIIRNGVKPLKRQIASLISFIHYSHILPTRWNWSRHVEYHLRTYVPFSRLQLLEVYLKMTCSWRRLPNTSGNHGNAASHWLANGLNDSRTGLCPSSPNLQKFEFSLWPTNSVHDLFSLG